jgi:hypothetical protein
MQLNIATVDPVLARFLNTISCNQKAFSRLFQLPPQQINIMFLRQLLEYFQLSEGPKKRKRNKTSKDKTPKLQVRGFTTHYIVLSKS